MLALSLPLAARAALMASALAGPYGWSRTAVSTGGWPSGLLFDERAQVREPLYRSDSIVFRETYAGLGGRFAVSPAFAEGGPRLSLAPIDFFDVDVQPSMHRYFESPYGLLPYDTLGSKLESVRSRRRDETVPATAWSLRVDPTLKLKVGPVVALYGWTVRYLAIGRPPEVVAEMVYEPFQDLVVAWRDVTFEHQPAAMYTLLPGDDATKLWLGATLRDRWSLHTGDRSTVVGALAMFRPGRERAAVPQIIGQALWYAKDEDRVGRVPNLQVQAAWVLSTEKEAAASSGRSGRGAPP